MSGPDDMIGSESRGLSDPESPRQSGETIAMEGTALLALLWGLVAGLALLIGATLGLYGNLSRRAVAWVMAFGSGTLISVIAFDIMDEAFAKAGFQPAALGFLAGAVVFTIGSLVIGRRGGGERKRSSPGERQDRNAKVVAFGTVIDGVPESIAIGLAVLEGRAVAVATVAAIFLSNIAEALSSSVGMKRAGHSAGYVFTIWTMIAALTGLTALAGYTLFAGTSPAVIAFTQGVAGGGLMAMIADTMIPEAFHDSQEATGLVAALGFVAAFALSHGLA
jgi:zinc transporter, ZIP family